MIIEDGTGLGYRSKVDDTNRLKTRSVTELGSGEAASLGNSFILTSGSVNFTNAAESAIFWYQNEDDESLLMSGILFSPGVSTGGTTNSIKVVAKINPTGLGSGSGSELIDVNSNFGSSKTLITTSSEIGQQGASITGGDPGPTFYFKDKETTLLETQVFIPKGTGVAFSVTPPTGNTSIDIALTLRVHKFLGV